MRKDSLYERELLKSIAEMDAARHAETYNDYASISSLFGLRSDKDTPEIIRYSVPQCRRDNDKVVSYWMASYNDLRNEGLTGEEILLIFNRIKRRLGFDLVRRHMRRIAQKHGTIKRPIKKIWSPEDRCDHCADWLDRLKYQQPRPPVLPGHYRHRIRHFDVDIPDVVDTLWLRRMMATNKCHKVFRTQVDIYRNHHRVNLSVNASWLDMIKAEYYPA